jgi:hypothetical protein
MFPLTKQYVVDENQKAIAVLIPIEQFERIEAILQQWENTQSSEAPQASDSLVSLIGSGRKSFETSQAADQWIRQERDTWDS